MEGCRRVNEMDGRFGEQPVVKGTRDSRCIVMALFREISEECVEIVGGEIIEEDGKLKGIGVCR